VLASGGIFSVQYPNHPITEHLKRVTAELMA